MVESTVTRNSFLADLGARLKRIRRDRKLSRRRVAEISDVSQRFLSQFEAGEGNISVARLNSLCGALEVSLHSVLAEQSQDNLFPGRDSRVAPIQDAVATADSAQLDAIARILDLEPSGSREHGKIALIGMQGAGKSTLAALLAQELDYELFEVEHDVESKSGLAVADFIALHGQESYQQRVREALENVLQSDSRIIVTTGGNIVSDATVYRFVLNNFLTVWVSASPAEHHRRLHALADAQSMATDAGSAQSLEQLLEQRKPLYALAPLSIDTTGKTRQHSVAELRQAIISF